MAASSQLTTASLWAALFSCFYSHSVDAIALKRPLIAFRQLTQEPADPQSPVKQAINQRAGYDQTPVFRFLSFAGQTSTHNTRSPEIRALIDSGQLSQARKELKAKIVSEGDTHETLLLEALILSKEKQFTAAMDKLQRSVALDSSDAEAHYQLAMNAIILNRLDIAEPELSIALALGIDGFMIHFHRGMLYYTTNRFGLAEAEFQMVIERNPKFVKGYEYLALTQEELKSDEIVIDTYRKAIEQVEQQKLKDESPYLRLLKFMWAKNRNETTLPIAQRAVDLNPNSAEAHFLLARLLERSGQVDQAQLNLKRSIEINPSYPEALYLLSRIYLKQGNEQESSRLLQMFRDARKKSAEREPEASKK